MEYNEFRDLWHRTLAAAGLRVQPPIFVTETINVNNVNRAYNAYVHLGDARQVPPFHTTVQLSWNWDAVQSARTQTTEEDMLMQVLGPDEHDVDTDRPQLRIDATLRATLPMDAGIPLPSATVWSRWANQVARRVSPLLPTRVADDEWLSLTSWSGKPEVSAECPPDGQLVLTGVRLPAWQSIDLPRQWDDPARPPDEGTGEQLAEFCARLDEALTAWLECLPTLRGEAPTPRRKRTR